MLSNVSQTQAVAVGTFWREILDSHTYSSTRKSYLKMQRTSSLTVLEKHETHEHNVMVLEYEKTDGGLQIQLHVLKICILTR